MKLLRKFAWHLFRFARIAVINSGLRRHRLGRSLFARLNDLCRLGLKITHPFTPPSILIHGSRMHLTGWENPAFPFTIKMLFDRFEEATTMLFERIVQPGMVVIDAGAHVGYYTLLAARLVGPEGKVFAFEPDETNYVLLQRNIDLNKYSNVFPVRKALSNKTGLLRLFLNPQGSEGHSIYRQNGLLNAGSAEVEATTLDDFLESQGWPKVDLIKMDIEGAEPVALKGMARALHNSVVQRLIVEFCPVLLQPGGINGKDFLDTLFGLGFSLSTIEDDGMTQPLQPDVFPALLHRLEKEVLINLFCEKGTVCQDASSIKEIAGELGTDRFLTLKQRPFLAG